MRRTIIEHLKIIESVLLDKNVSRYIDDIPIHHVNVES